MFTVKRIILGLLVLFFLSSLTRNFFEYRRNVAFYESYKEDYLAEKQRNTELKTKLVKSQDPYELEQTIRNDLNMVKGDEVAILLPEPSPTPVVVVPTKTPPYKEWFRVFFQQEL